MPRSIGKLGWMAASSLVKIMACLREQRQGGNHRTEVTEVTEGGKLGWMAASSLVNTMACVRERREGGNHRTEVTDRIWCR
jgi:hypothetical protein